MKVVLSAPAERDVGEIAFIAHGNKARALSFVRELRAKARGRGRMPHAFPVAPASSATAFAAARIATT